MGYRFKKPLYYNYFRIFGTNQQCLSHPYINVDTGIMHNDNQHLVEDNTALAVRPLCPLLCRVSWWPMCCSNDPLFTCQLSGYKVMSYNHQHTYIYLQSHVKNSVNTIECWKERTIQNYGKIQLLLFYIMLVDCRGSWGFDYLEPGHGHLTQNIGSGPHTKSEKNCSLVVKKLSYTRSGQ